MKRVVRSIERTARRLYMRAVVFVRACLATKRRRAACLVALAAVIVLVEALPLIKAHLFAANYDLKSVKSLVTPTSEELRKKLNFDNKRQAWVFNENAEQTLPGQTGDAYKVGGPTYSAELPLRPDAKTGLTLTDAQSKIDMSFKPEFALGEGQVKDGYAVYPITGTQSQLVYTFSQGGVKEDIILYKAPGDTAEFSYSLELPDSLEARLQDDGSVGIFGGDRTLFGNVSYGSDKDKELVEKARAKSKKDQLYYMIPAPEIRGDKIESVKAQFKLEGDRLTVQVSGLKDAHYPLSIDPSFMMEVTGCSWQKAGNNDMNTDYTGCQLTRSGVSGGVAGQWNFTDNSQNRGTTQNSGSGSANGMITNRDTFSAIAYNGFMYALGGGVTSGARTALVEYAAINSNGTLGTWQATTALPEARSDAAAVAYNGFVYISGGYTGGGSFSSDVKYAAVCTGTNNTVQFGASATVFDAGSDCNTASTPGTLSAWRATASMAVGRTNHAMVAYGSRIYIIDGCTTASGNCNTADPTALVYCGDMGGDGTIASWSTCNATGLSGRDGAGATVYNGVIYVAGGCVDYNVFACVSQPTTVQYAKINSDGSLGNWSTSTTAFTTGRQLVRLVARNGYLYLMGSTTSNYSADVQLAKVYAAGDLGPWSATSSFNIARTGAAFASSGDYLYVLGGCTNYATNCGTLRNDVQFSQVSTSPGAISAFTTETDTIPNVNGGLNSAATVFYGGYMYLLGGAEVDSAAVTNKVRYAKLNADGSTGAWAQTSAFTDARTGLAAAAYNGYMYIVGGQEHSGSGTANCVDTGLGANYCRDIQYAPINSDGTLGSWASAGGPYAGAGNTGRGGLGLAIYNGYAYVIGGNYNNNSSVSTEVDVAPINANGTVGTWTQNATALGAAGRANFQLAQAGRYVYIAGSRAAPGGNQTTDVIYSTLSSGGGMSAWASAGADFTGTRANNVAAAANGYLYVSTGELSWYDDVQYAKIDMSTGALSGGWTTSPVTVPTRRSGAMGGIYNGYLYIAGGCQSYTLGNCNSPINTVSYAQIHNGGGGITGAWGSTTNMPQSVGAHGSIALNGRLYVIGGCTALACLLSSQTAGVYHTTINADGSLGASWTTDTSLPAGRAAFGLATYNGVIYVLGGATPLSGAENSGLYTKPDPATGNITSWTATTTFTSGRQYLTAFAYNGYVYIAGGYKGVTDTTCSTENVQTCRDIQYAPINADGSLGAWHFTYNSADNGTTFAGGFTTTRQIMVGLAANGYAYILGGSDNNGTLLGDVQYAPINANGTIGAWSSNTSLSTPRRIHMAGVYGGYMYVYGGEGGSGTVAPVEYAPIFTNGMLGNWTVAGALTGTAATVNYSSAAHANGYFYVMGGQNGGGLTSSVQYTSVQAQPPVARHSILLTTDARTLPANFFTTVTPQSASSTVDVSVSTANDPAVVPNSLGVNRRIGSTTKYQLAPSNDGTKYYWVNVTLDDSQSMIWGETARSNMSYLQLNYHPNPGMRLRGGKTFNNNVQQSLSTP